jgi:hypothetical protein
MRLHTQTATIENGFVLPDEAHWLGDYLHELSVFQNGRYDDQVDSTAQALAWTKLRPPSWGIFRVLSAGTPTRHGKVAARERPPMAPEAVVQCRI